MAKNRAVRTFSESTLNLARDDALVPNHLLAARMLIDAPVKLYAMVVGKRR